MKRRNPLYRLTGAYYDNGFSYLYEYDAVGNRLQKQECLALALSGVEGGQSCNTTAYTYDIANRQDTVDDGAGAVQYTWDNNGDLLDDGTNTYTYASANRLSTVTGSQSTSSYKYNGLGDRLSQTVDSVTTNYTLDTSTALSAGLASGQTQVLDDSTHAYLYGNMRIAQQDTSSTQYFLTDALGSVRQLVDENSTLTLVQAYQPYGETLNSIGNGISSYAFAGEWRDASGLDYLRARYYAPWQGRFLTRDAWDGDPNKPMSYNGWLYGFANPVRYTDSSGNIPCELLPPGADQSGCQQGTGGFGSNPQPPLPPAGLPYCTSILIAAGEPCIPSPCPPGAGGGWLPTQLPLPQMPPAGPGPNHSLENWHRTTAKYGYIRKWLTMHDPEGVIHSLSDPYGPRLVDRYLIAFFISAEFEAYAKYADDIPIIKLAFAAMRNTYADSNQCGGNCDSVIKQLILLSNSEGFYGPQNSTSELLSYYNKHVSSGLASNIINGKYQHPSAVRWGNYKEISPLARYIAWKHNGNKDYSGLTNAQTNWLKNQFSASTAPYIQYSEDSLFQSNLYKGFVVMNGAQGNSCTAFSPNCMGW